MHGVQGDIVKAALKDMHDMGSAHGGIRMVNMWKRFDLFLFDGCAGSGAAGGGGEGGSAAGGGSTGMAAASQRAETGSKGDLSQVVYGKQPGTETADAAQESKEQTPPRDMNAEWQKLITGEFKDQYTRSTQNMINRRFAEAKGLEESNQKYAALVEKVAARYGVDAGDLDGLSKAIDGDTAFLREKADSMGMSLERYQEYTQAKRDAAKWQKSIEQRNAAEQQARQVQAWESEAAAMAQKYPAFNLDSELANKDFADMLRKGVSMEHAWKMLHYDEHMQGMAQYSAQAAEKQVVDNIQARGMRPKEGAAGRTTAVVHKPSAKDLTKADRQEVYRRVMAGEKITFG